MFFNLDNMPTDRDVLLSISLIWSLNNSLLSIISSKYFELSFNRIGVLSRALSRFILVLSVNLGGMILALDFEVVMV